MKDSVKAGWEKRALGEVCDKIQDGAHHSPNNTLPVREPGTFPYVTSKNIRHWHLDETNVTYVGPEFHDTIYPRCNAEFGDVLLTKDGANTGQVTINTFREPISLLSSVCLIKPNRSKLDPRFLVYYIQSDAGFENITGQMTGAAIKRIILKNIKSSEIPLPPLEEQQRIVAVLDEAFEGLARARDNAEANLHNADELFGSILAALVPNDNECPTELLGDICAFQGGTQPPKSQFIDTPREGYVRLLQIRDFKSDDKAVYVADNGKVKKCEASDIMIGRYGASVGQIHRGKAGAYNVALVKTIPDDNRLDRDYFYYYLTSDLFQKPLLSKSSRGAQDGFNQADISPFPVPVPSLQEQRKIVEKLDEQSAGVQELSFLYQRKLDDLDDLRQSLLQKAFAGELT